jgi:hypothetical protein
MLLVQQRFLTQEESLAVVAEFQRQHPRRPRLATWIMGWEDLRSDTAARNFVSTRPFSIPASGSLPAAPAQIRMICNLGAITITRSPDAIFGDLLLFAKVDLACG